MRLTLPLAALLVLWAAVPGQAQSRPDSLRLSCAQARSLVARSGSIVIGTGPFIYDRYVANVGFCFRGQFIQSSWIRTADSAQCFIGYRCVDDNPFFD